MAPPVSAATIASIEKPPEPNSGAYLWCAFATRGVGFSGVGIKLEARLAGGTIVKLRRTEIRELIAGGMIIAIWTNGPAGDEINGGEWQNATAWAAANFT